MYLDTFIILSPHVLQALKQGQYNGVVEKPMKSTDNAVSIVYK